MQLEAHSASPSPTAAPNIVSAGTVVASSPMPRDFIAKRICVVGCSGAGKSTFSRRCAALGYAHLELDGVVHQADWQPLPDDQVRARIDRFTSEHEHWVVDGNYTRFRSLLWRRADTIVWLDPGRWTVSHGVVSRSLRRLVRREELWNGNRERWSEVFSTDPERSVILWAWRRFPHYREEYLREMHSPRLDSAPVSARRRCVARRVVAEAWSRRAGLSRPPWTLFVPPRRRAEPIRTDTGRRPPRGGSRPAGRSSSRSGSTGRCTGSRSGDRHRASVP